MDIHIRNAKKEDYENILNIMNQVQKLHVEWRPDIYKNNGEFFSKDYFEQAVQKDTFYVAELNKNVIGILEVEYRHIESPSHVARNIVFIDTMAVDEEYRGVGVGHKFFEFIKMLKAQKHFDGIELQVNAKNTLAYEMYKKCGFTEKSINMEFNDVIPT